MPKLCVVKGFLPTTLIRFTHVHADVSVPTPPYGAVDTSRETPCFCRFVTGWGLHGFFARLLLGFFDCGILLFFFFFLLWTSSLSAYREKMLSHG